jgi:hypothetical protein
LLIVVVDLLESGVDVHLVDVAAAQFGDDRPATKPLPLVLGSNECLSKRGVVEQPNSLESVEFRLNDVLVELTREKGLLQLPAGQPAPREGLHAHLFGSHLSASFTRGSRARIVLRALHFERLLVARRGGWTGRRFGDLVGIPLPLGAKEAGKVNEARGFVRSRLLQPLFLRPLF